MIRNKLLLFCMIFFLLSCVSANGLISNVSSIEINKTSGINQNFKIYIINSEPFTFYNITLSNPYVTIPTISNLTSGQSVLIDATVNTNLNINTQLIIKGFYSANIGKTYKTYKINVSSQTPPNINPCDISIIEGDTIIWNNTLLYDTITMRDSNHNPLVGSQIAAGTTYTKLFSAPEVLSYYWSRFTDFPVTPICTITALSSSGIIYNPQLDLKLNLTINNAYTQTTLTAATLTSIYNLNVGTHTDGMMTVTNTGANAAHNINLQGDWLSFNLNNFDLNEGETRGLIYTLNPLIYTTNETNKTYIKNISITGNFNTTLIPLSIFINYTQFSSNSSNTDMDYMMNTFCIKYPTSFLCNQTPQVEIRYVANSSSKPFNITVTEQQVYDLWSYMFSLGDEIKTGSNIQKQVLNDISDKNNITSQAVSELAIRQEQESIDRQNTVNNILYLTIFVILISISVITGLLIYIYKKRKIMEENLEWKLMKNK